MINIGKYIEMLINWLTEHFAPFFDAMDSRHRRIYQWVSAPALPDPVLHHNSPAGGAGLVESRTRHGYFHLTRAGADLRDGILGRDDADFGAGAFIDLSALLLGIPLGIWSARSPRCNQVLRPILDLMQTMPAFVYLIPAVLFFGLGTVPGAFATIIFAMPPVVRLTGLGIRQVPREVIEASHSFGATSWQLLYKVQLPLALPTILTGINQTIMMSLSMVVIAAMISAGGLGEVVLKGITQMKIGLGFEGGIAVVILAIVLDRITQGIAQMKK